MPSKVVHPRISDWCLVGCYDLVERVGKKDTTNLPLSTVVKMALEACVRNAIAQGYIPKRDQDEIARFLHSLRQEVDAPMPFSPDMFDSDEDAERPDEEDEIRRISREVHDSIQSKSRPVVENTLSVDTNVQEEDETPTKINLADYKTFEELQKTSPKDIMIEEASTANQTEMIVAIRIVYSNVRPSEWGSPNTNRLVNQIFNNIMAGKIIW